MRCAAGASMLALVGCNQVFGIAPTTGFDASPDVAIDVPHVELTWQIAQVIQSGPGIGNPDPVIAFAPISPAPLVRIATLTGELGEDPASYSPGDGWIAIPRSYEGTTWRLEYILPDGVPRELQWAPEDKRGRITVPLFGRAAREPVPSGGGYLITPTNLPVPYRAPRVLTTGLWTEGVVPNVPPPRMPPIARLDYDFANAVSMSGARGRPEGARGDRALLIDYELDAPASKDCRFAVGGAEFAPDLMLGARSEVMPGWDTRARRVIQPPISQDAVDRLRGNLGPLFRGPVAGTIAIGRAASLDMPSLTEPPAGPALPLPAPAMHTLVQCPYIQAPPDVLTPVALEDFPLVEHIQLTTSRTIAGTAIAVSSGMATVLTTLEGRNEISFELAFPALFPTRIELETAGGAVFDLVGGTGDQIAVGPAGGFTVRFVPELPPPGAGTRADYFEVLVHKVGGAALSLQRLYTVTQPTVRIAPEVLAPASEYVLEVRSYRGRPMAARGDFAPVEYPYGVAIVFTYSFKTS